MLIRSLETLEFLLVFGRIGFLRKHIIDLWGHVTCPGHTVSVDIMGIDLSDLLVEIGSRQTAFFLLAVVCVIIEPTYSLNKIFIGRSIVILGFGDTSEIVRDRHLFHRKQVLVLEKVGKLLLFFNNSVFSL